MVIWALFYGALRVVPLKVYKPVWFIFYICYYDYLCFSLILGFHLYKNLLIEFSGVSRFLPLFAITLGVVFFSIAGIPPFAGFISK